jgi:hypothetical protein
MAGNSTAEGSTLDAQQDAMRDQIIDTDDSSGNLPEDTTDGRSGPRANRVKWEAIVARVEGMIAGWSTDPSPHSAAIVEVLNVLRTEAIAGRDAPREERANTGSHYVGQKTDGSRRHFQSTAKPTAKGFPSFVVVKGPYNSAIAADFDSDPKHGEKGAAMFERRTMVCYDNRKANK